MFACMCVHARVRVCMYVCMFAYMCVRIYCVYVRMYVLPYV